MSWKNLPSWVKGGIFLLILNLVLILIFFLITGGRATSNGNIELLYWPSFLITDLLYWGSNSVLAVTLFSSVFFFLVGAIIGFIVGKVKSRNENKEANKNG